MVAASGWADCTSHFRVAAEPTYTPGSTDGSADVAKAIPATATPSTDGSADAAAAADGATEVSDARAT